MTIIHQLTLPSKLQADSFEEFARQRYLPALMTGPTRMGQWDSVRLLRRRREHEDDPVNLDWQFLLLVEWNGVPIDLPRMDDPAVQSLFDAYAPDIVRLGGFDTVDTVINEAA
jgi:hypothetical protein